jgi:hypothetical protein
MVLLKYIMAAVLALAALEATRQFLHFPPSVHLATASVLYAYALATLLLLKPNFAKQARKIFGDPDELIRRRSRFALLLHAIFLLFFRVALLMAALAYLAQALSLRDAAFLRNSERLGFPSFLLMIFDATAPPLAAIMQYFVPDLESATLNTSNLWAVVFTGGVYLSLAIVAAAVIKDIWSLGYYSGAAEHQEELQRIIRANSQ